MSDDGLLGCLADSLGAADEALALAAYAQGGGGAWGYGGSGVGKNAGNPILKRSRLYYQRRVEGALVGLENQTATCYLNSLLQPLYLTPEFRQLLFDLSDAELGLAAYAAHEAAQAEAKAALERMTDAEREAHKAAQAAAAVEIDENAVAEFTSLGAERAHAVKALRKFPKPSQREQAMDYLFSHDFSSDPPDSSASFAPKARPYKRIPIEFRRFFAQLQLGTQAVISTKGITRSFGWDGAGGQAQVQHDIQELYIKVMEALSGSLAGCSAEGRLEELYRGCMATRTTCSVCGSVSARREHMYNFNPHVKGMRNLRHALEQLTRPEKLEGSNMYFCHNERCKKKVVAWRQDCIAALPPLLTFALNRHEYNKKNWQRVKINDRLPFPLVIDMAPFHEEAAVRSRHQLEQQAQDEEAERQRGGPPASNDPKDDLEIAIANSLRDAAGGNGGGEEEKENKQQQKSGKKNKGGNNGNNQPRKGQKGASNGGPDSEDQPLTGLEASVFDAASPHLYDLFCVVVHAGGAHGGHYYAYVKDVIAANNYFDAHPEARVAFDEYARDPSAASAAAAPGQRAAGYSGDANKSAHPSFWYELNDTSVSSISFDKIASQYGGRRTCAYILMYRARALDASPIVRGDGPAVPPALQERVARFNAQLEEERAIYDKISNEIEIELHTEEEFSVHSGQLYPRGYDPVAVAAEEKAEEERRALLAMEDAANGNGMEGFDFATADEGAVESAAAVDESKAPSAESSAQPESSASPPASAAVAPSSSDASLSSPASAPSQPRRLIVDQRITVAELYAKVTEFLATEAADAAKEGRPAPPPAPEKFVLNQLTIKNRPPHQVEGYLSLDDPLDSSSSSSGGGGGKKKGGKKPNPKTLEQLGFSSCQSLLVWNGSSVNGDAYHTGTKKDQVLHLRCCLFGRDAIQRAQRWETERKAAAAAAESGADGAADADAPASLVAAAIPAAEDRLELFLTVSPTTNLLQLAGVLCSRLGLDDVEQIPEALQLFALHPQTKALKHLPLNTEQPDEELKPLKILGVVNHAWIGIEMRPTQSQKQSSQKKADQELSLAKLYFAELQQCVRLVAIDDLPPAAAAAGVASSASAPAAPAAVSVARVKDFELDLLKSTTVLSLKECVLERLLPSHPGLTLGAFRLRKVLGMEKAGVLLVDETATLAAADLAEDDMRVRAESGPLPDRDTQLDVLVTLLANVSVGSHAAPTDGESGDAAPPKQALAKLVDRVPFMAEKSWTIKATKTALLARFGLEHRNESAFCLYRGHATYDEHGKPFTNEFLTLGQMQLEQSEWIWLEEGEVPTTGMIQIDVVMAVPHGQHVETAAEAAGSSPAASSSAASPLMDPTLSLADWRAMQQPIAPYTPAPAPVSPPADSAGSAAADAASVAAESSSAVAVPAAAAASPSIISQVFVSPRPSYFLSPLFSFNFSSNDTLQELKAVLHAYPNSPLGAALSPAHLRVRLANRSVDAMGKWIQADDKTLKKQGISADKKLVVQILPPDRPEVNPSPGALLLRVCTAVPHREGGVSVGPAALQELMFDDGEYPQLAALQRALAAAVGLPAAEDVGVLKWVGVALANKEQGEKNAAAAKEKESGASSSSVPSSSTPAPSDASAAGASRTVPKGWVVLFPNGPDPSDPPAANNNGPQQGKGGGQQGGGGGKKGQGKGGQQQGGKGGKQQQQGKKGQQGGKGGGDAAAKTPPPAWCLKYGAHALHEDDVVMAVSLCEFGCADLAALSRLARAWGVTVAPPGYALVEKDRADELERIAERERARKTAQSKHKEIELKIEY